MSLPQAKVIVNPAAGGYSVRREWPRIRKRMQRIGLPFDYEYSEGVGHAIEIAKTAVNDGYRYLVAVGGDGTVNEVANGILRSTASDDTILGIVSGGTECSFARSLGIPQNYAAACSLLTGHRRLLIDVGVVEYSSEGQYVQRYFVNEADVGFGATVIEATKDVPRHYSSTINHLHRVFRGIRSLYHYRNKHITLHIDNEVDSICTSVVVMANGCYLGGGMYVAPQAKLDDGLLDMVIVGDAGKFELLKIWPSTYKGKHITHPKIRVKKVTSGLIRTSERVLVEADGELIGECPVSFNIVPSALTIVV
jgi:YegS/Rv2252/BmrU family lipid kinase